MKFSGHSKHFQVLGQRTFCRISPIRVERSKPFEGNLHGGTARGCWDFSQIFMHPNAQDLQQPTSKEDDAGKQDRQAE